MKCLSLWQPWASLVGRGKSIETRSWDTPYRGLLAIHATKKPTGKKLFDLETMCAELEEPLEHAGYADFEELPFGCVLAVANLVDCRSTGQRYSPHCSENDRFFGAGYGDAEWVRQLYDEHVRGCSEEFLLGDYNPGRFGWFLDDIRPWLNPFPTAERKDFGISRTIC